MREKCCVNDPHIWKWDWLLISKVVIFGTGMPVDRWCKIQNLRKNALNSGWWQERPNESQKRGTWWTAIDRDWGFTLGEQGGGKNTILLQDFDPETGKTEVDLTEEQECVYRGRWLNWF